jgi:exodeoxyribonuclease V alpha subunit
MDFHFGCFLARQENSEDPLPALLGALVSHHLSLGHGCLPLSQLPQLTKSWPEKKIFQGIEEPGNTGPTYRKLYHSSVIGQPGDVTPLVLEQGNLYLHKYHHYEESIARWLLVRTDEQGEIDDPALKLRLDNYFESTAPETDWQRVGACIALTRKLAIITGGPGTGKTTTVVRILALLVEENPHCRIRMAAPTGKAAMRLSASVTQAVDQLAEKTGMPEEVKSSIPTRASTIHRLLGVNPSRMTNRFNTRNRLPVDIMILDEASMVDITLMHQLLSALPDQCRLILLGDKDQLPSIEAGNVLADLCGPERNTFSAGYRDRLTALGNHGLIERAENVDSPIRDCICSLQVSHRFPDLSTIGQLAVAINENNIERVSGLIDDAMNADDDAAFRFHHLAVGVQSGQDLPMADIADGYHGYLESAQSFEDAPLSAIKAFESYQLLCGVRQGPFGVENMNEQVEQYLRVNGLIGPGQWYHCRPVLITRNDYGLNLFNGDVGITLVDKQGRAVVHFQDGSDENGVRKVLPARLPEHETCWAMTIHKTQGSEFDRIAIVLPDKEHMARTEFLNRELLYTAVTRARHQVTIYGYAREVGDILAQSARRFSGLAGRLES